MRHAQLFYYRWAIVSYSTVIVNFVDTKEAVQILGRTLSESGYEGFED